MAELFFLDVDAAAIASLAVPLDRATRLDAEGRPATGDDWSVSLRPFTDGAASSRRYALVARPACEAWVGARSALGAAEVRHADHVFVNGAELLFSADALPGIVTDTTDECCPVCCEAIGDEGRLRGCPRCGGQACEHCWTNSHTGLCITPGCDQPAALDRELWRPKYSDFLTFEDGMGEMEDL